eukprot:447545_1
MLTDIIIKTILEWIMNDYEWFNRIQSRPASISTFWVNISLYPAHSTSGIFLILSYYTNNVTLFHHGLLIKIMVALSNQSWIIFYAISLNGFAPITGLIPIICTALDLEIISHHIAWLCLWSVMTAIFAICRFGMFYTMLWNILSEITSNNSSQIAFLCIYILFMTFFNVLMMKLIAGRLIAFVQEGILKFKHKSV